MKHFSKIIATQNNLFHAYLIASLNEEKINNYVETLLHKVGIDLKKTNLNLKSLDIKENIVKSDVIKAFNDLYFSSFSEQNDKILLIKNIDLANTSILNSILKTLEEPPKNTIIILTTQHIERVLPTIKSRCQVFNIYEDDKKQILNSLNKENNFYEYNTLFVNIFSSLKEIKNNITDDNTKLLSEIEKSLEKNYKQTNQLINFIYNKLTKENAFFFLSVIKLFFFSVLSKDFSIFPSFWKDNLKNWENKLKQKEKNFDTKYFEIIDLTNTLIQSLETAQNFILQKNSFLVNLSENLQ